MKKSFFMLILLISQQTMYGQHVGIGTTTPDNSAILDISSANRGLMIPRLVDTTAVADPKEGLVIFNQAMRSLNFHDGARWQNLTNNANRATTDSITVSVNGGVETPIRTYEQQAIRTLAADGQPNSSTKAGTFGFTKKYDVNSDVLKSKCYDNFSTLTTVSFRFYNMSTGLVYYQVNFERAYVYGCTDSTDPTNGFVETYLITANKIIIGTSSWNNGWP